MLLNLFQSSNCIFTVIFCLLFMTPKLLTLYSHFAHTYIIYILFKSNSFHISGLFIEQWQYIENRSEILSHVNIRPLYNYTMIVGSSHFRSMWLVGNCLSSSFFLFFFCPEFGFTIHHQNMMDNRFRTRNRFRTHFTCAGLYDEQFEMSSKIPFELVGNGPSGSVTLIMSIEQNALTGRLCNLVLRAPWFTSHVLKVGYCIRLICCKLYYNA